MGRYPARAARTRRGRAATRRGQAATRAHDAAAKGTGVYPALALRAESGQAMRRAAGAPARGQALIPGTSSVVECHRMPSMAHEILVDLFKNPPSLAAEIASADLTEIQPAEYRADAVVLAAPWRC